MTHFQWHWWQFRKGLSGNVSSFWQVGPSVPQIGKVLCPQNFWAPITHKLPRYIFQKISPSWVLSSTVDSSLWCHLKMSWSRTKVGPYRGIECWRNSGDTVEGLQRKSSSKKNLWHPYQRNRKWAWPSDVIDR